MTRCWTIFALLMTLCLPASAQLIEGNALISGKAQLDKIPATPYVPPGVTNYYWSGLGDSRFTDPVLWGLIVQAFNLKNPTTNWQNTTVLAAVGYSEGSWAVTITNSLAAMNTNVTYWLHALGANDVVTNTVYYVGDGVIWRTNFAFNLDQCHNKFPNSQTYIMREWRAGANYSNDLWRINNLFIPAVISNRPWCHLGPDETIYIQDADDGAAMLADGTHYSTRGKTNTAYSWSTNLFGP